MKLSQIKLSGFKSFAKPTTINVNGRLIGIVGPNGCGKSNIIDSIRWVLGESSAKQLRGDSMQDVIFSGSSSHRSLSRATVELIFDNSNHELTGLWNSYQEISVKRLISRQGDSNYYINNTAARKKDITDLFLGTGVGTRGYAVIEQGMISKIIEARPEELKMYLEEAAGVSKYRDRRRDTCNRLENTKNNLVRLNDIQSELIKQLKYLADEAEIAKQHQDLTIRIEQSKTLQLLIKINKANEQIDKISDKSQQNQTKLQNLTTELENLTKLTNTENILKNQEEHNLGQLNTTFNELRANLARLEERELNNNELVRRLNDTNGQIDLKLTNLHEEVSNLTLSIKNNDVLITTLTQTLEKEQLIKQKHMHDFALLESQYSKVEDQFSQHLTQINSTKHQLSLLNNSLEHKHQQKNSLENRRQRLELEIANNSLALDQGYFDLQEQLKDLNTRLLKSEKQLSDAKSKLTQIGENKTDALNTLTTVKTRYSEISSKISTIRELLIKSQNSHNLEEILGHGEISYLWQGIKVKPTYELAVEAVLGEVLNSIKVKPNQITDIKPQGKLSLWLTHTRKESPVYNITPNAESLASHVQIIDPDFSQIYSVLNQYHVVDNANEAYMLATKTNDSGKYVTKDGHLVTNSYIIFNPNSNNINVLEYQNRLTNLEIEFEVLNSQLQLSDSQYNKISDQYIQTQSKLQTIEIEHNQIFKQHHALNLQFTKEEQIHTQTKQHQQQRNQELTLVKQEINTLNQDLISIQDKIISTKSALHTLECGFNLHNEEKSTLEAKFNQAKSELTQLDEKLNKITLELELEQQKSINAKTLLADKNEQIKALTTEQSNNHSELAKLSQNQATNLLHQSRTKIQQLVDKITQQETVVATIMGKISELNQQAKVKEVAINNLANAVNDDKFKLQEQQILLQNNQESLDLLEISQSDLDNLLKQNRLTLSELHEQTIALENQINQLGLVNLRAIEDLNIANTRNQDLLIQISDLNQAIESLEAIILEIDEKTRVLLEETYTKVSEFFAHYFVVLFGGGIAQLKLISDDILNSGLAIMAQPPGKKNSSISMLSGGEKALTAMSFVFALFYLNPAPFCILDEVDAPLDDSNTGNFCKLVQELSNKTQFIYISHNRLTMEMADQLIGITMQEKGVSTTISVNLADIATT